MSKDKVPSRKARTLGAREHSLHLSRGLVRELAKHGNGDTGSLPRFRPPCGVTPYSCLSGRLHCVGYSTRVSSSSGVCYRRSSPSPRLRASLYRAARSSFPAHYSQEVIPHWRLVWRPNAVFSLCQQGTTPPSWHHSEGA